MSKIRMCDRCEKPIKTQDEMLQDQIDREYLGKDICPDCDSSIKLAEAIARQAAISGKSLKTTAQEWLDSYKN